MYEFTKRYNSVESALLLTDLYHNKYTESKDDVTESVFGSVLIRSEEDTEGYDQFDAAMDDYINFDVKKFFNLKFDDYMSLSLYEKERILIKCDSEIKRLSDELSEIQNDIKQEAKSATSATYDIVNNDGETY